MSRYTLTITDGAIIMLSQEPNDMVTVPMMPSERQQCRQALLDALSLLDDTEVRMPINQFDRPKPALVVSAIREGVKP